MLLDPNAITEGRKVEQVSILVYVLSLMPYYHLTAEGVEKPF